MFVTNSQRDRQNIASVPSPSKADYNRQALVERVKPGKISVQAPWNAHQNQFRPKQRPGAQWHWIMPQWIHTLIKKQKCVSGMRWMDGAKLDRHRREWHRWRANDTSLKLFSHLPQLCLIRLTLTLREVAISNHTRTRRAAHANTAHPNRTNAHIHRLSTARAQNKQIGHYPWVPN